MGHPTADDEPNSFVPPGGPDPEPTVRIQLTDEKIVGMWVWAVRQSCTDEGVGADRAKLLLSNALDIIEALMERIHELEKP